MSVEAIGAAGGMDVSQLSSIFQQPVAGGDLVTDPALNSSSLDSSVAAGQAAATRGADFAQVIGGGLQNVENLDDTAATKAIQAATGNLSDVHDYVIAADQAQIATELTTTLRDKALDSFNEIMRMPL